MRDEEESRDQEPEHTRFYRLDHSWSFDGEEVVYGTGPPKNDANAESDLDAARTENQRLTRQLAEAVSTEIASLLRPVAWQVNHPVRR